MNYGMVLAATGNKNKWRDWNLVIRKCSRERWGLRSGNGNRPSSSGTAMDDLRRPDSRSV